MSFVKGFTGGFGLVQNAIKAEDDREYRADSLAANSRNADALADYRDKTLGIQQQQANDLASYRTNNLALQEKIAGMESEYKTLDRMLDAQRDKQSGKVAEINAEAANTRADSDAAELDEELMQRRMVRDGETLNNIYTAFQGNDASIKQNMPIIESMFEQLEGSPLFDINNIGSTDINVHAANIQEMLGGLANGTLEELSDGQLGAMTDSLNIYGSKSIGQKVSAEAFPSAPREYDGYEVIDITMSDLKVRGSNANADVAVELQSPKGESVYYYPKLTEFRGGLNKVLDIPTESGMQAVLGRVGMVQNVLQNPLLKSAIEDYKVKKRGGEKAVREKVDARVELIKDALENNQSEMANQMFIDSKNLQGFVLPGENPAELAKRVDLLGDRVRRNYLYGQPAESRVSSAKDYAKKLQTLMTQTTVDTGQKALQRKGADGRQLTRSDGIASLQEIVGDLGDLNPNQMSHINAMITDGDSKQIPATSFNRLIEYLKNQGLVSDDFQL